MNAQSSHTLNDFLCHSPSRRGSTGFGQEALASLPGNIGTNDVLDCKAALQQAVHAGEGDEEEEDRTLHLHKTVHTCRL